MALNESKNSYNLHNTFKLLTFLATTSEGKFCFEMTHNARVQVFLSADFNTRAQRANKISSAKFAEKDSKKAFQNQQDKRYSRPALYLYSFYFCSIAYQECQIQCVCWIHRNPVPEAQPDLAPHFRWICESGSTNTLDWVWVKKCRLYKIIRSNSAKFQISILQKQRSQKIQMNADWFYSKFLPEKLYPVVKSA